MPYQDYVTGQSPEVIVLDGSGSEGISACFAFSHLSGFVPIEMGVESASTIRGQIPARVCLLGRDRMVYKTYTLPEVW
jgi:anaphase-promoting complex subunit 4